jgi:hypothetical protein
MTKRRKKTDEWNRRQCHVSYRVALRRETTMTKKKKGGGGGGGEEEEKIQVVVARKKIPEHLGFVLRTIRVPISPSVNRSTRGDFNIRVPNDSLAFAAAARDFAVFVFIVFTCVVVVDPLALGETIASWLIRSSL